MISEYDANTYRAICDDLEYDDPAFTHFLRRMSVIAGAQADARLELLLRAYIDQDGEDAIAAGEALALYTEHMLADIRHALPTFDIEDMQMIVAGMRARIEGANHG